MRQVAGYTLVTVALAAGCASHTESSGAGPSSTAASTASATTTSHATPSGHASSTARTTSAQRSTTAPASGVAACALNTLPAQAGDTVRLIHRGGPFPYPQNDGVVFGNYERHLPTQGRAYYHEYTVPTPGARNRGARRVVTGGTPLNNPAEFYYTGDHYETFCRIEGA